MQKSFLSRPIPKILFFEAAGTFFLVYGIVCSSEMGYPSDFVVACSLFLAISFSGQFTGGHFNPAVSVGLYINNPYPQPWTHVLGSFIGGFIGALVGYALTEQTLIPIDLQNVSEGVWRYLGEAMGTFLFMFSILIATTKTTTFSKKTLYVMLFIPASLYISRKLSGGAGVNPAATFCLQIVNLIIKNGPFRDVWITLTAPCVGGALAGITFKYLYEPLVILHRLQKRKVKS